MYALTCCNKLSCEVNPWDLMKDAIFLAYPRYKDYKKGCSFNIFVIAGIDFIPGSGVAKSTNGIELAVGEYS